MSVSRESNIFALGAQSRSASEASADDWVEAIRNQSELIIF